MTTMRPSWRDALVLGTVALLTWAAMSWAAPARAGDHHREVTTGPSSQAWYSPSGPRGIVDPTCTSPLGCALANLGVADYPEGALHIGAVAGAEEARSLLQLDLSMLPDDATLTGGTLTIPVGPASDGTSQPASARVQACLVRDDVEPATGDPVEDAPDADCVTSTEARVNTVGTSVTVDLSAFAPVWTTSATASLALVPTLAALADGDTWHLAFSSTDREDAPSPPPSATLTYTTDHDAGDREGGVQTPSSPSPAATDDTQRASPPQQPVPTAPVSRVPADPVPTPRVAPPDSVTDPSTGPVASSPDEATAADAGAAPFQAWVQAGSGAPVEAVAVIPLLTGLLGVVTVRSLARPMPARNIDPAPDLNDDDFDLDDEDF